MAAKKEQIPLWFNPHIKPSLLYYRVPEKFLEIGEELSRTPYENGAVLELTSESEYRLDTDYDFDYGSCHYSGDTPSVTIKIDIVKYSKEKLLNPNYERQLKDYQAQVDRINEWDHWKKLWDEQQVRSTEISERRKLAELKKKYEK